MIDILSMKLLRFGYWIGLPLFQIIYGQEENGKN